MADNKSQSNDHNMFTESRHTEYKSIDIEDIDMDPVYATLHFYYNDPDSMFRYKQCMQAPNVYSAVYDYVEWLHNKTKHCGDEDNKQQLEEAWNKLFEYFSDLGVDVPGWE